MLLSGFTFIRNARKYDFPVVECLQSMLPLVDELVVNVGRSEDETEELVASVRSPKIRVIHSVWDDSKTDGGLVLSEQTNLALEACRGRWALYLQADEALHESEHALIRKEVEVADGEQRPVDGIRLRYLHFYGGYSLVQRPWNWYPSEIRVVRRASGARSFGDAQSFTRPGGMRARLIDAHVFHYGHAREPRAMAAKIRYFHRFWHGDQHGIEVGQPYRLDLKNLVWYWGTHPRSHAERVAAGENWSLRPARALPRPLHSVLILADRNTATLAAALAALLERGLGPDVRVTRLTGIREWMKSFFMARPRRRGAALVDLRAERRSLAVFLAWVPDALLGYAWRVAHAPEGRMSGFRSRFYSAVSWGAHEDRDAGFRVPESEQPAQLARWLGVSPESR